VNGAHDMGGTMGFGPVVPERDEPAFHADWERRAFAATIAMGFTGQWNIDMTRFAREDAPPAKYLSSSYYEIWFEGLKRLLVERGLVTPDELEFGRVLGPPKEGVRALPESGVAAALARGAPTERSAPAPARFAVGDRVLTVEMSPAHHTRLPRYARGKPGTVVALHGAHVFPDTNARGLGEHPQWLYTVRFDARDLWGPDGTAGSVCVDCWESYLEATA
jgi:nitrile hydratase subunit beta